MNLSLSSIKHLARLARLELTKQEKEKFPREISSILDYVKKLQSVKTENVEPISQITGKVNVWREDKVDQTKEEIKKRLIDGAPQKEDNYIKVKKIFEG